MLQHRTAFRLSTGVGALPPDPEQLIQLDLSREERRVLARWHDAQAEAAERDYDQRRAERHASRAAAIKATFR